MTNPEPEIETMRAMISGYLDGELDPGERARFDAYAASHPEFRRELEEMRALMAAAAHIQPPPVPDEEWDRFLDRVYNRLERRVGWILTMVGAAGLAVLAMYFVVVIPWAPAPVKWFVEFLLAGLGILFVSVLRQRLVMRKTDRYSRDVKR
jgi:anti-sigma factor RsiW